MKKIFTSVLAMLMVASLFTGCGSTAKSDSPAAPAESKESTAQTSASGKTYNIVVLGKSVATDNWQIFFAGAKAAASKLGTDKVKLTCDGASSSTSYEEQVNMMENYISSGCDAISVAACSTDAVIPDLTAAHKNGVVVGITDTKVNFDDYDNFCAYDNKMAGKMAAQSLIDSLKADKIDYTGKSVVMICPVSGVQTLDDRMAGFKEELKTLAPDLNVIDPYYCGGDNNKALSNAQDAWQAYGDKIVAMYGLDEGVTDAISRCMDENKLKGKFHIVGVDATSLSVNDVKNGNVSAVIGLGMYNMGYQTVTNMYNILSGSKVDKNTILDPVMVTAKNMNDDDIRKIWDASALK